MMSYKENLVVFGGRLDTKYREFTNETIIYNTLSYRYDNIKSPEELTPRIASKTVKLGKFMVNFI